MYICGFKDAAVADRFRFLEPPVFRPPRKVKDILHDEEEEPFLEYFKLSWPQWKNVKVGEALLNQDCTAGAVG